jgi:hypothetical protein
MCVIPARAAAPMFSAVQIPPPTPIRSVTHVMSIPILSRVTRTFLTAGFSRKFLCPDVLRQALRVASPHSFLTAAKARTPGLGPALRCRGFGSFYGILRVFTVSEASLRFHSGIRPAVDSFLFRHRNLLPPRLPPALLISQRLPSQPSLDLPCKLSHWAADPFASATRKPANFPALPKSLPAIQSHRFEQILRRSQLPTLGHFNESTDYIVRNSQFSVVIPGRLWKTYWN